MASEEQSNPLSVKDEKLTNESVDSGDTPREDEENPDQVYIQVAEDENDEAVELPCEKDNSILLSTVASQFPGASGLKYRNPDTNTMRGLRLSDGKFLAPEKGWDAYTPYYCVFPRDFKRKTDDDSGDRSKKFATSRTKCSDLIVLGLPWKITEDELKEYFEQYGETVMIQIKKDLKTGQSKGFGFVRFSDYDTQMRVVAKRHNIFGRWCDVRVPLSKGEEQFSYQSSEFNRKIFVGRITEDFTCEDLRNYFKKFGEISDVFIPKPFRAFAFITFKENDTAQTLCGEDHLIKNVSVHVSNAVPKVDFNASGYHNHSNNQYGNHSYGSHHQSNYSHHNQMRYSPYNSPYNKGSPHDMRRQRNHQYSNQSNNSMHNNGNPLVNSTYNPHPMATLPPPNSIWQGAQHVANGAPRADLPPMPVTNAQYGMNPMNPLTQKHYGQH